MKRKIENYRGNGAYAVGIDLVRGPTTEPASGKTKLKFTKCMEVHLPKLEKDALFDAIRDDPYSRDAICEYRANAVVTDFEYVPQTWDGRNSKTGAAVDVKSANATNSKVDRDLESKTVDVGFKQWKSGHDTNCEVIKYYFIGDDVRCLRFYDSKPVHKYSALKSPYTLMSKKNAKKTRLFYSKGWTKHQHYAEKGKSSIF